ncbi:ferritin-like domain-containing protein [Sphingomonas bacterium]|uniref:ferritin-like domain-containing protein n=1 Tax=Sphingomonas bacterium TaxID=1895847 RepID=UPI00157571C5|nr:ferritin-like domain-containing protein [Sphingomonas bacterium]
MRHEQAILDVLDRAENQRRARRTFIRMCGGAAVMAGLLAACKDDDDNVSAPSVGASTGTSAITDPDILNFALNLEYLEANYYTYAVTGVGIAASLQTGTGTQGAVITGSGTGAARAVSFSDAVVAQYAREIAGDEIAHVTFLRSQLGGSAVAQPAINLSGSASVSIPSGGTAVGAFTAAARAAGVIGANDLFDPFLNDTNFLIGSYLLTDVGVSAYRGSARLITNKTFLEASAGILAVEAYHDGVIRSTLYARGVTDATIYPNITKISNSRDSLDGSTDLDQDIGTATTANLVPTDANSLTLGRTASQVLNVVYLNAAAVAGGGFFPAGVNGTIRSSAAQA